MDKQIGDCPCKRQRVSQGDEVDQETGMVLDTSLGPVRNEQDFQSREASTCGNEVFKLSGDVATVAGSDFTAGASGDCEGNVGDSRSSNLHKKDNNSNLHVLHLPRSSGDEDHCTRKSKFEQLKSNHSTGSLKFEQSDGNQSTGSLKFEPPEGNQSAGSSNFNEGKEITETGSQAMSRQVEPDLVCCAPNLNQSVADEGRIDYAACKYVKNVQAIAESGYIRAREQENFQKEYRRIPSTESPKLKRSLDNSHTQIYEYRVETSSKDQSKADPETPNPQSKAKLEIATSSGTKSNASVQSSKELESSGNVGVNSGISKYSEELIVDDLAECDKYKEEGDISKASSSKVSEEPGSGQQVRLSDLTKATTDVGTKAEKCNSGNSENTVTYVRRSLDDSGFIEMFSNSVIGNIMCGNGSYRNSGKTETKDSGNSAKNSNTACKSAILRTQSGETRSRLPENRNENLGEDRDCGNSSKSERSQTNLSEPCRLGELSNILEDIGQVEEDQSAICMDRSENSAILGEPRSSRVGVCELSNSAVPVAGAATYTGSEKSAILGEPRRTLDADQATNIEPIPSTSRQIMQTPGFSGNFVSGTTGEESEILFGFGAKVSSNSGSRELHERDCNGRFKIDFKQMQEIIGRNNINSLPLTILVQILKNLTVFQLLRRASLVCKYWYNVCRDPDIWRSICLVNQHRLSDYDLEKVLDFSDYRVRNVNLTDCRFVTNIGIKFLVMHCPMLEVLRVMRCFDLTDVAFEGMFSLYLCKNLRAMYMDGCCRITDNTVEEVSEACPELRTLHLNQCTRVSDHGIITVAQCCPHLVDLQLDHCSQVTDDGIAELVMGCPNLLYLNLMCCGITDTGVKYLAKLTKLTNLDLSNIPRLTPDSVVYLSKFCEKLQCINVSLNTVMDDNCVAQLARNLPVLKRLYCVSCTISDKGLEDIAKYRPTLEALDVGWCQEVTDHGVRVISLVCKRLDYFGLIRCDRVTIETIEDLVLKYPKINYSTFILESRRLLERARKEGYQFSLPRQ